MNKIHLLACLLLTSIIFQSCKKYEEGPGLSLRSKTERVNNSWKIDKYIRNGADETSLITITSYKETYDKDGNFIRSYFEPDGTPYESRGKWEFEDGKESLKVSGVSSFELTDNNSSLSSSSYKVLKLKESELWYYFENGSDKHEIHLVTQE